MRNTLQRLPVYVTTFLLVVLHAVLASPSRAAADTGDTPAEGCVRAFPLKWMETESHSYLTAAHCTTSTTLYRELSGNRDLAVVGDGEVGAGSYVKGQLPVNPGEVVVGIVLCATDGPSGPRCGAVTRTDYAPSYLPDSYGFYLIDAPCRPGDSGGGWTLDGAPAGITSGFNNRTGNCIVSPLDIDTFGFDPWD